MSVTYLWRRRRRTEPCLSAERRPRICEAHEKPNSCRWETGRCCSNKSFRWKAKTSRQSASPTLLTSGQSHTERRQLTAALSARHSYYFYCDLVNLFWFLLYGDTLCYLSFLHHVLLDLIKNYTYFNIYQILLLFKLHIITLTFPFFCIYAKHIYTYLFYDICYNSIYHLLLFF